MARHGSHVMKATLPPPPSSFPTGPPLVTPAGKRKLTIFVDIAHLQSFGLVGADILVALLETSPGLDPLLGPK